MFSNLKVRKMIISWKIRILKFKIECFIWWKNMFFKLKVFLALLYPNLGFYYGVQVLQVQEGTGAGCQFSNLFTRTLPDDPITMGVIWILFLANVVIFGFLTWYMDSIKPGPFGVAKKWYFIFQVCSILWFTISV